VNNITKVTSKETKNLAKTYIYSGKEKNYRTKYEERDPEYNSIAY